MKLTRAAYALLFSSVFPIASFAAPAEADHASHHPDTEATKAVSPSESKKADTTGKVSQGTAPGKKMGEGQMPMMDMMKDMQGMMGKIQLAKTPEEKQKLMGEHMEMMQRGMKMMMDMKGMSMMGGKQDDTKSGMPGMSAIEQRMDMMEQMMNQMMQHQAAEKAKK